VYTDQMKTAVHSLDGTGPKGFYLQIIDNDHFLTVKASEKQFMQLVDDEKRQAIEYMAKIKAALEMNGAIVLLVREGGEDV